MYRDTVTIFNFYGSRAGDMWYPTVLRNVDFHDDHAAIVAKYGENAKDNAKLHVPYRIEAGRIMIGNKEYLTPKEWEAQTNDRLTSTITFSGGESFDFFYVGDWGSEAPIPDDDDRWTNGFYNYMNKFHDKVYAISSVGTYKMIPHFEILAR